MPEAPSLEDQPINDDVPAAPESSDQPSDAEDSLPEFDYSGIPDDQREIVEGRIKGFQAKFTQAQQGLAEARREAESKAQILEALQSGNPDVARAILSQLGYDANAVLGMYGYELPEQEDDDDYVDPGEQALERLQQMEADRARQENEAAVDSYIQDEIKALEGKENVSFTDEEKEALNVYARNFPKEEVPGQLYPDVDRAHALLTGVVKAGNKRLIDGKKAPRKPGGGGPGSRTVDPSKETPEERRERMEQAVASAQASGA